MARKKSEPVVAKKPTRLRKTAGARRSPTGAAARTGAKLEANASVTPGTEAQIRQRAYYIYLERRSAARDPVADWYQAERELNATASGAGR